MKANLKLLVLLSSIILLSISCVSTKIKTEVVLPSLQEKKVVLMPTLIGKVRQPALPLIDAGIFNKKTNTIANEIMDYEESIVKQLHKDLIKDFDTYSGAKLSSIDYTASGNKLNTIQKDKNYPAALLLDNDHFPKLISSNPTISPFKFKDGEVIDYFKNEINYKNTVQELCRILEADALTINYNQLYVVSIGAVGSSATIRLDSHVYVIDKNGRLIGHSIGSTKPVNIKGKKIEQYKEVWNSSPELFSLIAKDIGSPAQKKK